MYSGSDICGFNGRLLISLLALIAMPATAMVAMDDAELGDVVGQSGSLFLSDTIRPGDLTALADDPNGGQFTFHRMGLDARLDMNLNIAKLQLGCGGINDALTPGCDIDIDFLSFMGINAAGDRPSPDGPDSTFQLIRPTIELAIKNESSATQREVAGIKIGAERINGALSFGQVFDQALINPDSGVACNPSASTGSGVIGCNSGLNSISGFLSLEMSAGFKARATLAGFIGADLNGCLGRLTPSFAECNSGTTPFFVEAGGTRLDVLHAAAAQLQVSDIDLGCNFFNFLVCSPAQAIANAIVDEGFGQLVIDTRLLHFLTIPDTENFFLSFQREAIAWPNASKAPPANNLPFDICNPAFGQQTARCSSAFAPKANTGWWLNAPGAKLLNINPPGRIDVGNVTIGTALSLFGPEGQLVINNPKLDLQPTDNCRGSAVFC